MTGSSAVPRLLLFVPWLAAALGGSFMVGVSAIVQTGVDPCWLTPLHALLLELWVAIAVALALGRARRLWASVLLGAFLMSLVFMATVLGNFYPFAAGLGDRQLESYGGDIDTWDGWLTFALAFSGIVGALLGVPGGFLSWAFGRLFRAHVKERQPV